MGCNNVPPSCAPFPPRSVPPFCGFTEFTPTIPKLYWNVKSQEQRILRICELLDKLACYADFLGDNVQLNRDDIEALKAEFLEFKEHGFDDYYLDQIERWVYANMPGIIGNSMKMVFFGCTVDGHFTAYIPESWQPIVFDAGYDYNDKNTYGRLILDMYVTDTFQVNGKPTDLIWEVVNNG